MTAPASTTQARPLANGGRSLRDLLGLIVAGCAIGGVVALALYVMKSVAYVALLPAGVSLVCSVVFFKNARLFWFSLFLLSLQFTISKNLNDGLTVVEQLQIDYTIDTFTFKITATELCFFVLLALWANDWKFHGKTFVFPRAAYLALAYLGLCLLSLIGTKSPYLGFVELVQQINYFLVYLYAVNCLDGKKPIRLLAIIGVVILVTQAGMCVTRFYTGYMTPLTFGETYQDSAQIEQYLAVDRSDEGSYIRAFGTLGSPGSTVRLCMMFIPFALLLSARNGMFGLQLLFGALAVFGIGGLALTFTRVYYITTAVQGALAFLIMVRDRMLKRAEIVLLVLAGLAGLAAITPKLYEQFTVREDSASTRLLQYEAAGRMILDHPLLGVGLNNGTGVKPKYVNLTYNKYDPNTQFYLEPTHNLYLNLTSEVGIPASLLFFGFFGVAMVNAYRQSRRSPDAETRFVANALFVAFAGVMVNSLMDPLQEHNVLEVLWLFAGISYNLPRLDEDKRKIPV